MRRRKGFSIVEMLVAVALFTAVVLMSIAALLALIDANSKTRSIKIAMDNLGFIFDDMARDLRVGSRYRCQEGIPPTRMIIASDATGTDCSYDSGGQYLAFRNKDNYVTFYYFNNGTLKKKVTTRNWSSGYTDALTGDDLYGNSYLTVSSSDLTINRLRFYVYNTNPSSNAQPYVVITATVTVGATGKPKNQTTFSVQTTVSQRIPHNVD